MHHSIISRRALVSFHALLIGACLALAACTSAPPSSGISQTPIRTQAENARATGNLAEAAALYRQLAATGRGAQRSDDLLTAASLSLEIGDYAAAGGALDAARETATPAQRPALDILSARVDVAAGRPAEAIGRLDAAGPVGDPGLASIAAEARGLALFALGRPAQAVEVLVEREIWLDSAAAILANQRLIWDGLATLQTPPPPAPSELVAGWLALAPLTRLEDDPAGFRRALLDWRTRFETHPAAAGILAEIIAGYRSTLDFPRRVALLLPLGSTRRAAAQAVRDGFMAARLVDAGAAETVIAVYDTSERGALDAYTRAQADGADFIVGPLLPESVDQIATQAGFVPTLALNFSQSTTTVFPPSLYQYALSPEDEVRAIAARAIAAGQRTAIALFASDDRGYRLMASFREAFEALGGQILAASAYVPESRDASGPIADALNVSRSEQRFRRLQANLGRPVEFETRRRQDVDMIFLQATPNLGRLLAPQLRFHKAGDIPTYSTSDINDTARGGRDADLNGVIFPDLPLLVAPDSGAAEFAATIDTLWPQRSRQWIRLYGFGYDAYTLIRPIFRSSPTDWPVRGMTGVLELDVDGRIHRRELPFAQFRNGTPAAMAAPAVASTFSSTESPARSGPELTRLR